MHYYFHQMIPAPLASCATK